MNPLRIAALFIGGVVFAAAVFGVYDVVAGGGSDNNGSVQNVDTSSPTSTPTNGNSNASLISGDCMTAADIFEEVRPSVVEIDVSGTQGGPFGNQEFSGTGSGIVLDEEGHILTNNHVAGDANNISVKFDDGSTVAATLVGTDTANDLAVIIVDPADHDLSPATLGDSDDLRVGDPVLAIGNPFSLEGTLTAGIVSALDRAYSEGNGTRPIRGMIQTDAPINPGNSGGPLINCQGEVVGVNTLLENPTGDSVNVGVAFAVAINTAKAELNQLKASETVQHAYLGVSGVAVTSTLNDDLNLTVDTGVYILYVADGGPADTAGLKGAFASENAANSAQAPIAGGDVIVSADGNDMSSIEELASYLDLNHKPGDTVELGVVRDGESITLTATLGTWPTN
jgi:S1-C subfamily serine protease